jgi:hypothetical protein
MAQCHAQEDRMSLYSNSGSQPSLTIAAAPQGSTAALASIAVLTVTALVLAATMKLPLVLPALALASTVYAMVMGGIGYTRDDHFAQPARLSAGVFAFAAVAASILGSPDQVALLFQR